MKQDLNQLWNSNFKISQTLITLILKYIYQFAVIIQKYNFDYFKKLMGNSVSPEMVSEYGKQSRIDDTGKWFKDLRTGAMTDDVLKAIKALYDDYEDMQNFLDDEERNIVLPSQVADLDEFFEALQKGDPYYANEYFQIIDRHLKEFKEGQTKSQVVVKQVESGQPSLQQQAGERLSSIETATQKQPGANQEISRTISIQNPIITSHSQMPLQNVHSQDTLMKDSVLRKPGSDFENGEFTPQMQIPTESQPASPGPRDIHMDIMDIVEKPKTSFNSQSGNTHHASQTIIRKELQEGDQFSQGNLTQVALQNQVISKPGQQMLPSLPSNSNETDQSKSSVTQNTAQQPTQKHVMFEARKLKDQERAQMAPQKSQQQLHPYSNFKNVVSPQTEMVDSSLGSPKSQNAKTDRLKSQGSGLLAIKNTQLPGKIQNIKKATAGSSMPSGSRSDLPMQPSLSSNRNSNNNCPLEYSQTFEGNEIQRKLLAPVQTSGQTHVNFQLTQNDQNLTNIEVLPPQENQSRQDGVPAAQDNRKQQLSPKDEENIKLSIFMKTYFDQNPDPDNAKQEAEMNTEQEIYLDHLYKKEKNIDKQTRNQQQFVSREILDHIKEQTSGSELDGDSEANLKEKSRAEEKGGAEDFLHRLPNNYFMQDDDEEDLDMVVKNIEVMRTQMIDQVKHKGMEGDGEQIQSQISDIANIIEPQKFIEKHYQEQIQASEPRSGDERTPWKNAPSDDIVDNVIDIKSQAFELEPPKFLFEQLLKDLPTPQVSELLKQQNEDEKFEKKQENVFQQQVETNQNVEDPNQSPCFNENNSPRQQEWAQPQNEDLDNPNIETPNDARPQQPGVVNKNVSIAKNEDVSAQVNEVNDLNGLETVQEHEGLQPSTSQGVSTQQAFREPKILDGKIDFWGDDSSRSSKVNPSNRESGPVGQERLEQLVQEQESAPKPQFFSQDMQHLPNAIQELSEEQHMSKLQDEGREVRMPLPPPTGPTAQGPRVLKMADYFTSNDEASGDQDPHASYQEQANQLFAQMQTHTDQTALLYGTEPQASKIDGPSDVDKLEKQLLQNVNVNFLFQKGESLYDELIDANRLQQVVDKIKEQAKEKEEDENKDINVAQIADFLRKKDMGTNQRTAKPTDAGWTGVVSFLRANPKLLMEMIPGSEPDLKLNEGNAARVSGMRNADIHEPDLVLHGSRINEKIIEAQKWQQLQQLSQSFMQRRDGPNSCNASNISKTQAKRGTNLPPKAGKAGQPRPPSGITRQSKAVLSSKRTNKSSAADPQRFISISSQNSNTNNMNVNVSSITAGSQARKSANISKQFDGLSLSSIARSSAPRPPVKAPQQAKKISEFISEAGHRVMTQSMDPKQYYNSQLPKPSSESLKVTKQDTSAQIVDVMKEISRKQDKADTRLPKVQVRKQAMSERSLEKKAAPSSQEASSRNKIKNNNFMSQSDKNADISQTMEKASDKTKEENRNKNAKASNASSKVLNKRTSENKRPSPAKRSEERYAMPKNEERPADFKPNSQFFSSDKQIDIQINSNKFDILSKNSNRDLLTEKSEPQRTLSIQTRQTREQAQMKINNLKASVDRNSSQFNSIQKQNSNRQRENDSRLSNRNEKSLDANANQQMFIKSKQKFIPANHYLMQQRSKIASDSNFQPAFVGSEDACPDSGDQQGFTKVKNQVRFEKPQRPITAQAGSNAVHDSGIVLNNLRNNVRSGYGQPINASMNFSGINILDTSKRLSNDFLSQNSMIQSQFNKQPLNNPSIQKLPFVSDKNIMSNQALAPMPPKFIKVRSFGSKRPMALARGKSEYESQTAIKSVLSAKTAFYKPTYYQPMSVKGTFGADMTSQGQYRSPKGDFTIKSQQHKRSPQSPQTRGNLSPQNGNSRKSPTRKQSHKSKSPQRSPQRTSQSPHLRQKSKSRSRSPDGKKSKDYTDKQVGIRASELNTKVSNKPGYVHSNNHYISPKRGTRSEKYSNGDSNYATGGARQSMACQTDIRGVEHKILIRPDKFDSDPFEEASDLNKNLGQAVQDEDLSAGQNASMMTPRKIKSESSQYRVPTINWSDTPVYTYYKCNSSNPHILKGDMTTYTEGEVDYVLDMIKNAYNDFKRTDIMKPFYMKSLETLKFLLTEQTIEQIFERVANEYGEITLENTMKLLIRCKLAFNSRNMLMQMFANVDQYYDSSRKIKQMIDKQETYKIPRSLFEDIQNVVNEVLENAAKVIKQNQTMSSSSHRQFKNKSFLLNNKQVVNLLRAELGQIRNVVKAFKVQREGFGSKGPHDRIKMGKDDDQHGQDSESSDT